MAAAPLAFEAIHREFCPKVVRYLAGIVGEDDAADLAQVTMIKVSEHLAEFRGECALSTWIYRIAANVAIDRLRSRTPERRRSATRLVPGQRVIHFDAMSIHRKYSDVFLIDDVPEQERMAAARKVADAVIRELQDAGVPGAARPPGHPPGSDP